ncbi:MAG: 4Fe-4S cluster-binding domain-containing protein [Candidatus Brocadiaceae bacterium]|nr:4Fe-4S cluster-binding domain-containing protein [Candidatus Brocadiaceae bacterium]
MQIQKCIPFNGHDVFLIPGTSEGFLLYAPTLRRLLKISNKLARMINEHGLTRETSDKDVIAVVSLLDQSLREAIKPFPIHMRKSKYFHLALGLTKDCTLGCLYCHASAGKREEMPPELLNKSIHYAFETAQKNGLKGINISFAVGGEPTTSWNLFISCIRKIKESETQYGIPVYLSMTTNGYYGPNKRRFIADHLHSVLLSLDGSPEIQNLHRPSIHGKESYSVVSDTARFFIENVRSFAIRATISNHSVKIMPEIVEFFSQEFGNQYHLVFEPLFHLAGQQSICHNSQNHGKMNLLIIIFRQKRGERSLESR